MILKKISRFGKLVQAWKEFRSFRNFEISIGIVKSVVDLERPWPTSAYSGRLRENWFWFEKIGRLRGNRGRSRENCGQFEILRSFSAKWRSIRKTWGHYSKTVRDREQFMAGLEDCGGLEDTVVALEKVWPISGKVWLGGECCD